MESISIRRKTPEEDPTGVNRRDEGPAEPKQGRELPGTYIPLLIGELFMEQSKKWKPMAMQFVFQAWRSVRKFLDDVLDHVADGSARQAILQEIIDPAMDEKLRALTDKVDELMTPYSDGFPSTLNRRFVSEIGRLRSKRGKEEGVGGDSVEQMDMDDHACSDLLDCMQAYYAIALDVFVDNVAALTVENCLVKGLSALLSPVKISEMTDAELETLAAEPGDLQSLRDQAMEKKTVLEESLNICRRHQRKIELSRLDKPKTSTLDAKNTNQGGKLSTIVGFGLSVPLSEPRKVPFRTAPPSNGLFATQESSKGTTGFSKSPSGNGFNFFPGKPAAFCSPLAPPNPGEPLFVLNTTPSKSKSPADGSSTAPPKSGGLFGSPKANPDTSKSLFGSSWAGKSANGTAPSGKCKSSPYIRNTQVSTNLIRETSHRISNPRQMDPGERPSHHILPSMGLDEQTPARSVGIFRICVSGYLDPGQIHGVFS